MPNPKIIPLLLTACVILGCQALISPPPWADAADEYEALSLEYQSLAQQLVVARQNGQMSGNQWRAFALIQETVGTISRDMDAAFAEWEALGRKPAQFDTVFGDLRDEMVSLRKLVDRVTNPRVGRSARRTAHVRKVA